jgi:hypothetical protein
MSYHLDVAREIYAEYPGKVEFAEQFRARTGAGLMDCYRYRELAQHGIKDGDLDPLNLYLEIKALKEEISNAVFVIKTLENQIDDLRAVIEQIRDNHQYQIDEIRDRHY